MIATAGVQNQVVQMFPDIDWARFFEADQALNWELWHGVLPSDYWTDVEPLEHYKWRGCEQAEHDIRELLADLPEVLYYDEDADFLSEHNPYDDNENYTEDGEYVGPENVTAVDPRKQVMHTESWKQVF